VLREVDVDLAQLDPESADFDLQINSAYAFRTSVFADPTDIASPVYTIPRPFVVGHPWLVGNVQSVHRLGWVRKPIRHELGSIELCRLFIGPKVAFSQSRCADVYLSLLADGTQFRSIFLIDDEKLYVEHALTDGNDVGQLVQEIWILVLAWNWEVGHSALGFGRAVEVDNIGVGRQVPELGAILLGQEIAHEKGVPQGLKLSDRPANQNLSHCWR
jgi:hypothetical protein